MFNIFKKDKKNLVAVVSGTVIKLEQVNDEVFSSGMMGKGIAIQPSDGNFVAPGQGEITLIPESKHAVGMKLSSGMEILIHIGLDTVMMKGQGFEPLVQVGQKVKAGDPIMKVDLEFFKGQNIDVVTPVIILNGENFQLTLLDKPQICSAGETKIAEYE